MEAGTSAYQRFESGAATVTISSNHTPTIAVVTWHDAHSDNSGSWTERSSIDDDPYIVRSVGFILDPPKPGHVSVIQSVGIDDALDHILHIPTQMVQNVRYLDEGGRG